MSVMKSAWRLLRQRNKARKSFREFCEITVFKRLPWRVAAPHHDVVCRPSRRSRMTLTAAS